MATIKYLLQSKSTTAPVYARLSLGKNISFKRKTGLVFDYKKWSAITSYPKTNDANGKKLKNKLKELDVFVIEKYNTDYTKGVIINSNWLVEIIDEFHGRAKPNKTEYLSEYGEEFINKLPNKVSQKGLGASKDTITKYTTIVKKLKGFENYKKKKFLIKEVDLEFRDEFVMYLTEEDNIGENTAGRYLSFVKSIVLDARKHGRTLSPQIDDFKGFTVSTPIVTLTNNEIEQIKATKYELEQLNITRDWLIIGCYVGQRVSDLLRMTTKMIIKESGFNFISLIQKKTKKEVQIPIHHEVNLILNKRGGEFPPIFASNFGSNSTIFNKHLKEVCRIAKINYSTIGNLNNPSTNRYETGEYPKWKLISSHTCRRSFATNFYALKEYPTPLLMSITGHSTEKMFLKYIGKSANDYALQTAKIFQQQLEASKKETEPIKFKVIRNASNL
jgi:integrase